VILFGEEVNKSTSPILPVITNQKNIFVNINRDGLYFLGVVTADVPPLLVLEFLHRVCDVCLQYFGSLNESVIRENFATVYQILDEMMDNGIPFTTEPNALMEMIPPPSMFASTKQAFTGESNLSGALPEGNLTNTPWRKLGVRYAANEIYFDIIEEMDAIIEPNGLAVNVEIAGEVQVLCKLTGMPDLSLTFNNPHILDDVSFHPCVRYNRYEQQKNWCHLFLLMVNSN